MGKVVGRIREIFGERANVRESSVHSANKKCTKKGKWRNERDNWSDCKGMCIRRESIWLMNTNLASSIHLFEVQLQSLSKLSRLMDLSRASRVLICACLPCSPAYPYFAGHWGVRGYIYQASVHEAGHKMRFIEHQAMSNVGRWEQIV